MRISNRTVTVHRTPVYFGNEVFASIDRLVGSMHPSGIYILVDPETKVHCLPVLLERCASLGNARCIVTGRGEAAKTLEQAVKCWDELLACGADRSGLIINLGGGVVSDLGGFVAAGYKRGIRYINVPTSLMGQADAAVGGKTAVNVVDMKNQVGFFYPAEGVFIFTGFLKTLPNDHMRSGLAEIMKCALISDVKSWRRIMHVTVGELLAIPPDSGIWHALIGGAITFKNRVVMQDFREHKLRKVLNFGHTIGHAIEGLSLNGPGSPVLHGDAVAAGMICASYLSHCKSGLSFSDLESIASCIHAGFPFLEFDERHVNEIIGQVKQDKKSSHGNFQFTLISRPGHPLINVVCDPEEIRDAILFYNSALPGAGIPSGAIQQRKS